MYLVYQESPTAWELKSVQGSGRFAVVLWHFVEIF